MSGAQAVLAVNIAVACLFAAGYAVIAIANPSQRRALWFTVSYFIGMLSPIGDFLSPLVPWPEAMEWLSYGSFLAATLSISATFSVFHGRPAPWRAMAAVLVGGLALRAGIWSAPRDTLIYGMAYQLPFTLAAGLAMHSVLSVRPRRALHIGLAAVFGVIAGHFLAKPFLAAAFGSGETLRDYVNSTYALLSQASSGILLLAAGIVLLLIVAQRAITESQAASETDPLSGLANRRGFDRQAQAALARAAQVRLPVCAVMFDLDHFKRINDGFGHDAGDAVIAAFGALLRTAAPRASVLGRTGGEEFVMLLEGATDQSARLAAESVRIGMARATPAGLPLVTLSGGVAELRPGEDLSALLRRADQAAYRAKGEGRDRICVWADRTTAAQQVA